MVKQHELRTVFAGDGVAAIAELCRDAYITSREMAQALTGISRPYKPGAKWDGGHDRNGKYCEPYWPTLAKFVIDHRFCPYVITQALFSEYARMGRIPFPNQIPSAKYLKLYRQAQQEHSDAVVASLMSNVTYTRSRVRVMTQHMDCTARDAVARVILGSDGTLSPLFCYCLARSEDLDRLAEEHEAAAVVQFISAEDAYLRTWSEWIPADFIELVARTYKPTQHRINGVIDGQD